MEEKPRAHMNCSGITYFAKLDTPNTSEFYRLPKSRGTLRCSSTTANVPATLITTLQLS